MMMIATLLSGSSKPKKLRLTAIPGGGAIPIREPVGNTTSAASAGSANAIASRMRNQRTAMELCIPNGGASANAASTRHTASHWLRKWGHIRAAFGRAAMHGTFCWNELMTHDIETAKKFYADTIGWTFDAMPMPDGTYWIA